MGGDLTDVCAAGVEARLPLPLRVFRSTSRPVRFARDSCSTAWSYLDQAMVLRRVHAATTRRVKASVVCCSPHSFPKRLEPWERAGCSWAWCRWVRREGFPIKPTIDSPPPSPMIGAPPSI